MTGKLNVENQLNYISFDYILFMKKLSFKICVYKNCSKPNFQGTSGQKFCKEHRNKICRKCSEIKEEALWDFRTSLCRKCESERVSLYDYLILMYLKQIKSEYKKKNKGKNM